MEDINRRFGQLIQSFFGDSAALTPMRVTPPVDIEETDDAYVVEVDVPNVRPEDVTIEMLGEELHISGKVQQRETTGVMRRQSRPTGEFEYVVDLPGDIDRDRIEATYDNGVLTVTVAKTRDAHPRRIEVRQSRKQDGQSGGQPH
jgi:HSP20 family protein